MPKSKWFSSARFVLLVGAALILVLQASASRMLKIDERNIGLPGLREVPWRIGSWKAAGEQAMDAETVAVLKPDEYILRDYANAQSDRPIGVFVAYFKSLQNVYGPHSPSICLPASGWLITSSKSASIPVANRAEAIPVNEYTMEKGTEHILVLYWYQNDRDVWAEEYHAKLRLLPDLIRYHRSDVSLVRLITPLNGSTPENEFAHCTQFMQEFFPLLAQRFGTVHAS